ncbi:MAG: glucose-6-phosphate isomerase [Vulcanimicrobiota bacterium]
MTTWQRFQDFYFAYPEAGLTLDLSRSDLADLTRFDEPMAGALAAMEALEAGAVANPDEQRMVGHYWLRFPELAPEPELTAEIRETAANIKTFVARIKSGGQFRHVLSIGIGGSALGPQFIYQALTGQGLDLHFFDNTDPAGFERTLKGLDLAKTLVVVISKSGGTPETFNGMLVARKTVEAAGLSFAKQAVAVTGLGSKLDQMAEAEGWLARFPMWDWVGGRTSVMSAVGLVPCGLAGVDCDALLEGARVMDNLTRRQSWRENPAALLAAAWHAAGNGKGAKDMVILPYKDSLELFSRYLQQLVMESLGKALDRRGKEVHQGIAVYGNKGSTDQHAYVQQLRDGLNNFFATFIVVLEDGGRPVEVAEGVTSGDYLSGFWQGTRQALSENGRSSITLTVPRVDAFTVGGLIALYERAVGLYAELVDINAYHQPGVEAGKKAAADVLELQKAVETSLGEAMTASDLADRMGRVDQTETIFHILQHLAANGRARMEGSGPRAIFAQARAVARP